MDKDHEKDNEYTMLRIRVSTRDRIKELAQADRRTMTGYLEKLIEREQEKPVA